MGSIDLLLSQYWSLFLYMHYAKETTFKICSHLVLVHYYHFTVTREAGLPTSFWAACLLGAYATLSIHCDSVLPIYTKLGLEPIYRAMFIYFKYDLMIDKYVQEKVVFKNRSLGMRQCLAASRKTRHQMPVDVQTNVLLLEAFTA